MAQIWNILLISMNQQKLFSGTCATPWIYKCIAHHAMLFFLLANILTGAVNLTFQPAILPSKFSIPILSLYTLTLFVFIGICGKLTQLEVA